MAHYPDPPNPNDPSSGTHSADASASESRSGTRTSRLTARYDTFWNSLRVTARLWGFLAFILLVLILFRNVVFPFVLALLLTYVLAPVLRRLTRLRIGRWSPPRVVALLSMYAVIIGVVVFSLTYFVPRLAQDVKHVLREMPGAVEVARERWVPKIDGWLALNFGNMAPSQTPHGAAAGQATTDPETRTVTGSGIELKDTKPGSLELELIQAGKHRWILKSSPPSPHSAGDDARPQGPTQRFLSGIVSGSEDFATRAVRWTQVAIVALVRAITTLILVLMISAFLLMDTERFLHWLRNLVPPLYHDDFDRIVALADKGLSGAIRGQLLICLINALLTGLGLLLFRVKYAVLLAAVAGILSVIPIFGSIVSSVPIVLVALVSAPGSVDVLRGLMVLAWIVGIHLLEANFLNPKIIGSAARIHPVIVIFVVLAGQKTYGAAGALLAVPLLSAVRALFIYLRAKARGEAIAG